MKRLHEDRATDPAVAGQAITYDVTDTIASFCFGLAFEVPVAINNDANLAALAEQRVGAARGHGAAAVLTLGTNIGLGLILDGEIHRGAFATAKKRPPLLTKFVTGTKSFSVS